MKRILLMAVSSSALALAAPGTALAHHHHHAKRHHKHHAARARVLDFRASAPATTSPTTTTPSSTESAGKVASFKEGVLTITLTNGQQVSGKVTEATRIQCPTATQPGNEGEDDDQGSGDDEHSSFSHDAHQACNGAQGHESSQQSCTTAALTEGALVRDAELSIGPSGAVWDHVDLM
jgi:hypothetical protein